MWIKSELEIKEEKEELRDDVIDAGDDQISWSGDDKISWSHDIKIEIDYAEEDSISMSKLQRHNIFYFLFIKMYFNDYYIEFS